MENSRNTPDASRSPGNLPGGNGAHSSVELLEKARADADAVLKELGSQPGGLGEAEADARLKQVGTNEIAREKRQSALMRLLSNIRNPLVLLLLALGVLSYLTGDLRAMVVIFVMVVLGVVLRFFQEMRADNAAEKLKAMVSNTATLVRDGKEAEVLAQDVGARRYRPAGGRGHGSGRCTGAFRQRPVPESGGPHR